MNCLAWVYQIWGIVWSHKWKNKKKKGTKNKDDSNVKAGLMVITYKSNKQYKKTEAERKKMIMRKKKKIGDLDIFSLLLSYYFFHTS